MPYIKKSSYEVRKACECLISEKAIEVDVEYRKALKEFTLIDKLFKGENLDFEAFKENYLLTRLQFDHEELIKLHKMCMYSPTVYLESKDAYILPYLRETE